MKKILFLGYNSDQTSLIDKIEEVFSSGKIGGLIWSSPNNPTWVCLKESELKGIGKLLTKYDVIGIEDAAYFGMDAQALVPARRSSRQPRVLLRHHLGRPHTVLPSTVVLPGDSFQY